MMAKKAIDLFDQIIVEISTEGRSLRDALKGKMSSATFFEIIKDENKQKQYARACEERADLIADEVFDIADNIGSNNMLIKDDNVKVQRDRLRVDSRKWLLSKLNPKKYGDKIDVGVSGNITLRFDKDDEKA
jgi:hypothetical protein